MRRLAALAFFAAAAQLAPAAATAAEPAAAAAENRMAPLAELVGTWRGSGWVMTADGTRTPFQSQEIVTLRLSGAALLVEGRHWSPGRPNEIVHDAMAMITWDASARAYRFRSALASGRGGDFPLEVGERRFSWRMALPQGTLEYVTTFANGTWHERGRRILPDGRTVDIFEMTLRKQ